MMIMRHDKLIFILLFLALLSRFPETVKSQMQVSFPDIQEYDYKESIEALASEQVILRYPDGNFGPNDFLDRAQMVTLIMRTLYSE